MENINLGEGWNRLWQIVTAGAPGITTMMSVAGVALIVVGIVGMLWQRWRGQGGGGRGGGNVLTVAVILGTLLAAPGVIIPVLLMVLELLINVIIGFLNLAGGN